MISFGRGQSGEALKKAVVVNLGDDTVILLGTKNGEIGVDVGESIEHTMKRSERRLSEFEGFW